MKLTHRPVKAEDVKNVIDGWAADFHQSFAKLKAR